MEFIRPSSRSSSISQDNLHSLFVTLREYLFFGRCSCRVEALQILSVLSSVATLTLVAFLFFFSSRKNPLPSWSLWCILLETVHCPRSMLFRCCSWLVLLWRTKFRNVWRVYWLRNDHLLLHWLPSFALLLRSFFRWDYPMFHEELLFNVLVVSISSSDDSVLLTMPSPTARDDLYSALSYLLSYCLVSLLWVVHSNVFLPFQIRCLSFPFSQPSLLLFVILCSSGELAHVTSALSDVTELLSSVSSLELRLQLSQRTCETYNLLPLTVGLLLTMHPREWNPNEELWNACTLKELGNQRSQRVFPLSEKIYYLFKMVMVGILKPLSSSDAGRSFCWMKTTFQSLDWMSFRCGVWMNNHQVGFARVSSLSACSVGAGYSPIDRRAVVFPHSCHVESTCRFLHRFHSPSLWAFSHPHLPLFSCCCRTFRCCHHVRLTLLSDAVRYYQLDSEYNDVINTNNFTSLLSTVTTVFHYLVGFTMRDMSLSLMNRPFLREYSEPQEEGESRCVDTQALIDRRSLLHWEYSVGVNIMKQRFHNVIILADASLNETVMRILLFILQSGTLWWNLPQMTCSLPVQNLFAFLLEYLKLFEQADGDFVHSVFSTVLKLYMTTHGDRCVGESDPIDL